MIEHAEKIRRARAIDEARRQEIASHAKALREGLPATEGCLMDKYDRRNPNKVADNDDN